MISIFQEMEDDLNFSGNGRRPQFFRKWKMTSISQEIEEKHFSGNRRRPQFFRKWKPTSIFQDMEEDLNFHDMEEDLNF
jgi:hypothetical protein